MPKNIVFCADGTWNHPGETQDGQVANTNVYKFYKALLKTADELRTTDIPDHVLAVLPSGGMEWVYSKDAAMGTVLALQAKRSATFPTSGRRARSCLPRWGARSNPS